MKKGLWCFGVFICAFGNIFAMNSLKRPRYQLEQDLQANIYYLKGWLPFLMQAQNMVEQLHNDIISRKIIIGLVKKDEQYKGVCDNFINFFNSYIKVIDCLTDTLIINLIAGCKVLQGEKFESNFKLSDRSKKHCILHMKIENFFKYKEIETYINKISGFIKQPDNSLLSDVNIRSLITYTESENITAIMEYSQEIKCHTDFFLNIINEQSKFILL
jgi:hypothetical protein